jgi:hypothetical protein
MRLRLQVVVRLGREHQPDDVHFRGEIRSDIKPTCPGTKVSLSGRVQLLGVLEAMNAGNDRDGLFGQIEKVGDPGGVGQELRRAGDQFAVSLSHT